MMTDKSELLCWYCREQMSVTSAEYGRFRAECDNCGVLGPEARSEEQAYTRASLRTQPSVVDEQPDTQGTDGLAGELVESQREFVEYHRHQAQTYIALGDRIKPEQRTSLSYHITKMSEGMETLCAHLRGEDK